MRADNWDEMALCVDMNVNVKLQLRYVRYVPKMQIE